MSVEPTTDAYTALDHTAVLADRSARARVVIRGPDRAKFLHNLTTQDIKRLPTGEGREAFVTSPQGKTLGHVTVLAGADELFVLTEPESVPQILPHLQKYGVFDEVTIENRTSETFEYHLAGPKADATLASAGGEPPEPGPLRLRVTRIGGANVLVFRESPTGRPGLTLIGESADSGRVAAALTALDGVVAIGPTSFEVLRIEGGYPLSGRDVTPENLPQEVGRDALAINFVKGCYLGQETVARIDALGHVNKLLRGLRFAGAVGPPPIGSTIEIDGKKVGTVTSAAYSPACGCVVGLGYVRAAHATAGTEVRVTADGENSPITAVVSDLPIVPA